MDTPSPAEPPRSEAADAPLRDDVRRLGATIGDLLSEQVGPRFLETVEKVRTTAIRRREKDAGLPGALVAARALAAETGQDEAWAVAQVGDYAEAVRRERGVLGLVDTPVTV